MQNNVLNNNDSSTNNEHIFGRNNSSSNAYDDMDVIGDGTYGIVYKAREKATGKIVALKRIKMAVTEDGLPLSAVREITSLKHLYYRNHPNIVKLLDTCQGRCVNNSVVLLLVFEHLDQNLEEFIRQYKNSAMLDIENIRNLSKQLMNGVDFLHTHRIVHRDLKPQNILLSVKDANTIELKIADFGLSKIYDYEMRLTTLVQTLYYRAPEVIFGQSYNTSVDIWSCGCIIAEIFKTTPLFQGTSEVTQLNKIFEIIGTPPEENWPQNVSLSRMAFPDWPPTCLKTVIPSLTVEAVELIACMLVFDASKRISAKNSLNLPFLAGRAAENLYDSPQDEVENNVNF